MSKLDRVDYSAPKKRISVFVNESMAREAKAQATREGYTLSEMTEMLYEYYLNVLAYSDEELAEKKPLAERKK